MGDSLMAANPVSKIFVRVWLFGTGEAWQHEHMRFIVFLLLSLTLTACATGINPKKYNSAAVKPESFTICHGYSCTNQSKAGFTAKQWKSIAALFRGKSKDAKAERSKIAHAIAKMEQYTGAKTGTAEDLPMAGAFKESGYQLDCIDETVNTTQYLTMLQDAGFLKFHGVAEPTHRGYLLDGRWPHNTAVMREKNGALWAVDSFYRANGEEPYIVPRADWLAGWRPPGANQ